MKRVLRIIVVFIFIVNMVVFPNDSATNVNASERLVLSAVDARNLICFLYNTNETIDNLQNDDMYKFLTGQITDDEEYELKRIMFASLVDIQLDKYVSESQYRCNLAYKNLTKYLEGKMSGLTEYPEDLYNEIAGEYISKAKKETKNVLLTVIGHIAKMTVTEEMMENIELAASAVSTVKGIRGKAQGYIDKVMAGINAFYMVINQEQAGRYTYFGCYLSNRQTMQPNDWAFRYIMDYNRLALSDKYALGTLDWYVGDKKPWTQYVDDIERWAELTYQIIGDVQISDVPIEEPGVTPSVPTPSPAASKKILNSNLYINGDYAWESGTLDLNGYSLIVDGTFSQKGGSIISNGGIIISNKEIKINKGTINNGENGFVQAPVLTMSAGTTIDGGEVKVLEYADLNGVITGKCDLTGNATFRSASISTLNISGDKYHTLQGGLSTDNLIINKNETVSVTNPINVRKEIDNRAKKMIGGKNIVLNSTGNIKGNYYDSEITIQGASVSDVVFGKNVYATGDSSFSNVIVNNSLIQSGTLNLYGDLTVIGDANINGTISGESGSLKLKGDLSGSSAKIRSLIICGEKKQAIKSSLTVTDFYNNNKLQNGLSIEKEVTVNGNVHSETSMSDGKNIRTTATASFTKNYYNGDITLGGLSGNLPPNFNGNLYISGGEISLNTPAVIHGDIRMTSGTLTLHDTEIEADRKFNTSGVFNLKNSKLILNGVPSLGGTIDLQNSEIVAKRMTKTGATISLDSNSVLSCYNDISNTGKITGQGIVESRGDIVNNGTVDINVLKLHTDTTSNVGGKNISAGNLYISGRGKVNLDVEINVSDNYYNDDKTSVNSDKIILPKNEDEPLKEYVSTTGLSLDNKVMEIEGDCKVSGGAISLVNGAKLIIGKSFTASGTTFNVDGTSEIIVKRYTFLSTFSDVINDGKITFGSDTSLKSVKLSGGGGYILLGDLYMSSSSINKPEQFTLSGGTPQVLSGDGMNFKNLTISNHTQGGIRFDSAAVYSGEFVNNNSVIRGTLTKEAE